MSRRLLADFGLLIVALIWGVTFPIVKVAVEVVSPFAFNAVRFAIACLFFLPLIRTDGFADGFKIGVATFLGYTFQTFGLQYTTATNAGFITSLYVVLAPIIAFFLYGMSLKCLDVFATFLALIGMFLLTGYKGFNFGDLLVLACAFAFAMEIAMISYYSRRVNPTQLAFWQIFAVAILSTPFALITDNFVLNRDVAMALIITAVFATVIAKIMQNWFQRWTKPADASVIMSMEGVFSHVFAVFMLGESLKAIQYVGAGLIVLAVILVSLHEHV